MKLTPPTMLVFWIAVILGLVGLLAQVGIITVLGAYAFWLVFIGLVLLVLGLMIKGL